MISRRLLALCALLLVLGACGALSSCRQHPRTATVARLDALAGVAERANATNIWQTARVGDEFAIGDAVRTGHASSARVRLTAGGSLNLAPETVLRFARNPASATARPSAALRVESGEAEVESGADAIELETAVGHAHIERGTHVRISARGGEHFEVVLGHVTLDEPDGHRIEAHTGERMIVAISGAILEPIGSIAGDAPLAPGAVGDAAVAVAAVATAPDGVRTSGAADAHHVAISAHTGTPAAAEPEPSAVPIANAPITAAAMTVSAGESATIHDERAPTPLAIRFGTLCTEGGSIEFSGRGAPATLQGAESAVVVLPAGHYNYAVRCNERGRAVTRIRAFGRLHVLADSGHGEMPTNAPRSFIDTDGRRYSVLYQNILPEITARWPAAPTRSGFTLNVRDGAGRTRTFRGTGESVVVPSGALAEGSFRIWMSNAGGQRSIDTVLVINFDNAARTAQLSEPHDPLDLSHGSVRVAGSALASSVVTVGTQRLPLDAQNRFRDMVPVDPAQRSLVIRIAHPSHGVQYYLRRVGTASL